MSADPADYWRRDAGVFNSFYGAARSWSPKRFVARFLDERTDLLGPMVDCPATARVLDLGCGAGVHMRLLAGRCASLVGVDYSPEMLKAAEQALASCANRNWTLVCSDASRLPLADEEFDFLVSMGLLDYVDSPAAVLRECRRVLKPGSGLAFTIPKRPSLFAFLRTGLGNKVRARVFGLPPIRNAVSAAELEALLSGASLKPVRIASLWTTMWLVKAVRP